MKTPKGRKAVHRNLPELEKACGDFKGFSAGDNRTKRIGEILATVAHRCRRPVPVPFYAMREVADFFGVSLTTVTRVYGQLNRQGTLTLVRGSQSTIPPRSPRPRSTVRGMVCMPIWLPGFLRFVDWRTRFSAFEEALSRRHFVLQPVFYRYNEDSDSEFVDRVLKFNPDYILWEHPNVNDFAPLQSLADTGISILTVVGTDVRGLGRIYRQTANAGLAQGLKEWSDCGGIKQILVPLNKGFDTSVDFMSTLKTAGKIYGWRIQFEFWKLGMLPLRDYLQKLKTSARSGIFFADDLLYTSLCSWAPEEMLNIIRRNRVIMTRRATIPEMLLAKNPADMSAVKVDTLFLSERRLARKIAEDLSHGLGMIPGEGGLFEAQWRSQRPFTEVVQRYLNE